MSSTPQSQARTYMFARVLGPYLVIVTATAMARTSQMRTLLADFGTTSVWPWVTGAFVLLSGLVVVALHQYWRGAAAVIVSVLGWLTTLKGLFLLAIPRTYISAANSALDVSVWWWTSFAVAALAGLYLTYVGWVTTPSRPTSQTATSTPDLPRAA
ncbi:membrane protein [Mycobacterium haemophilum]|uniref:Membrane protein n=1 Tax=Mycobacterium haemophilum TaxID=29311 RepID=A0A0I9U9W2_9MYCO|nr:membrane protein [Mycobacterium haemophilum]AKN17870.1 hypothetical protein B586_16895 [Mycobacterium haemophilum DSM 44634]KLO33524.1 membrane protein [Mycobacterium haemophilum]KLO39051.1 membrane protein [Mycobacterium haemophilum]KLO45465.1 membrane protein [Mycobacterium haemophilum]KLO56617.1 membrane protein [Mycobacterium haemophilum]